MKYFEIKIFELTIWFIKRGVGKPCLEEDEDVTKEYGCLNCRAYRVIKFLKEWIELIKM